MKQICMSASYNGLEFLLFTGSIQIIYSLLKPDSEGVEQLFKKVSTKWSHFIIYSHQHVELCGIHYFDLYYYMMISDL